MIAFHCARCGERLEFSENMGGQSVPCPRCRDWISIPKPSPGLLVPASVPTSSGPYPALGENYSVGSLDGPLAATLFFNIAVAIAGFFAPDSSRRDDEANAVFLLVILVVLVPAIISSGILLHRWWSCLPPGWRQTTPGKAVGLSFVPFYCFYWWFVAYGGLANDLNQFMNAKGLQGERISKGLAHGYVIVTILGLVVCWVPVLTSVMGLVGLVLFIVFALSVTRACKAVIAANHFERQK